MTQWRCALIRKQGGGTGIGVWEDGPGCEDVVRREAPQFGEKVLRVTTVEADTSIGAARKAKKEFGYGDTDRS